VIISGTIDGDARINAEELSIIEPAVILGELHYTSPNEALIDNNVTIDGGINWKLPKQKEKVFDRFSSFLILLRMLLFVMVLITGLALILLFRNHTRQSSEQIEKRFWHTLAIGFLMCIVCTMGAFILLTLIIGIPLGLLLILIGILLFYIGKIYVSIVLGRLVFRLFFGQKRFALGWEFIIGLIILSISFEIPGLGIVIYLLAFIIGSGAAVTGYIALNKKYRRALEASGPPG
jgi:hypothetical protein